MTIKVDGADGGGTGSGFVLDRDGHIITNNHVVASAASGGTIKVELSNGTEIDALLRNLGVRSLIVVGAWTNMAVEHTVRDAADHGYDVTIVTDATSSLSEDWQRGALEYALTNIASIVTTATLLGQPHE